MKLRICSLKNQDFKELKGTYVIFICQHDKFKENKPIYHVDKIIRENEKGRDAMCESFEKLANKYADDIASERVEQTKVDIVKSLMENMKWTLDQALTASGIQGKERAIIAKQLQK